MTGRSGSSSESDRLLAELIGRCTFPTVPAQVVCAVSGGPDSLALLALATHAGLSVTAVHVDHGLRPGSAAEADVVAAAASTFGARFRAETVVVAPGPNLEARARAARYAALPDDVMTGHTADDQAETILLNVLRGSGSAGLAGMRSGPAPRRPILGLRRAETLALVEALGVDVVHDPSNLDPRHRRNRVRHELLPLLDSIAHRDVAELLVRQADLLRDESDLLDRLAASIDPADAVALTGAPVPLARRAVRAWLTPVLGGYPPDAASVERVLAVAAGSIRACELPGGARVTRRAQRLNVVPPATAASVEEGSPHYTHTFVEAGASHPDRTEGDA